MTFPAETGSQQTPDSAHRHPGERSNDQPPETELPEESRMAELREAYPTDAKEREKERRKKEKEQGIERVVQKRKKIMEDHHDDCGDDLSSLRDTTDTAFTFPCDFDTDEALSDEDHDQCLKLQFGSVIQAFPIDLSKVAKAKPGSLPAPGPDPRAPKDPKESKCPGCRQYRGRSDWEHSREIGQCKYPHDEPWVPACEACQKRLGRSDADHSFREGECKWATKDGRTSAPRKRSSAHPHEPEPKAHAEPTAGIPAVSGGQELGADGEQRIADEDRKVEAGGSTSSTDRWGQRPRPRTAREENLQRSGRQSRKSTWLDQL